METTAKGKSDQVLSYELLTLFWIRKSRFFVILKGYIFIERCYYLHHAFTHRI